MRSQEDLRKFWEEEDQSKDSIISELRNYLRNPQSGQGGREVIEGELSFPKGLGSHSIG